MFHVHWFWNRRYFQLADGAGESGAGGAGCGGAGAEHQGSAADDPGAAYLHPEKQRLIGKQKAPARVPFKRELRAGAVFIGLFQRGLDALEHLVLIFTHHQHYFTGFQSFQLGGLGDGVLVRQVVLLRGLLSLDEAGKGFLYRIGLALGGLHNGHAVGLHVHKRHAVRGALYILGGKA